MDLRSQLCPSHPEFERRGISATVLEELRGIEEREDGDLSPVILTHLGRATTQEQEEDTYGKWFMYPGFKKSLELYNIDLAILDPEARRQALELGHLLVVEGPFDVAKLYEAGIRNVVATFGAHLAVPQVRRLRQIAESTGTERFLFFYDRDAAGQRGAEKALAAFSGDTAAVRRAGSGYPPWVMELTKPLRATLFDWEQTWSSHFRTDVGIPNEVTDPCDLSVEQLRWLRGEGIL